MYVTLYNVQSCSIEDVLADYHTTLITCVINTVIISLFAYVFRGNVTKWKQILISQWKRCKTIETNRDVQIKFAAQLKRILVSWRGDGVNTTSFALIFYSGTFLAYKVYQTKIKVWRSSESYFMIKMFDVLIDWLICGWILWWMDRRIDRRTNIWIAEMIGRGKHEVMAGCIACTSTVTGWAQ